LLGVSAGFGQAPNANSRPRIHRNTKLERRAARRLSKLKKLFQPEAKPKLTAASLELVLELVKQPPPIAIPASARSAIEKQFPAMTPAQSDLMTFATLAEVARVAELLLAGRKIKDVLDSKSELGETESLRLQMAMDRMSKFMTALSNLMKKTSDTSSSIIQNLK
jgi:hypothetical protein